VIRRRVLLGSAGVTLLGGRAEAAELRPEPDTVVYPRHEALQDAQVGYIQRLLFAALARSGRPYKPQESPLLMVQSRSLIELARPAPLIDVFWTMSNPERERHLLPVRIPIDRGLLGWRIALVRRADVERWKNLQTLAELALYTAGQMHDWPDTQILRVNGLPVETATNFLGLFNMLAIGRFDYFPRSLMEIGPEREQYRHMGLEIEPYLLLHYPAALYFFVAPTRPRLAEDLNRGLEKMLADGSFEQMFQKQFAPELERFHLGRRRILQLSNPELPTGTPLQRKALWWSPKL
jgi:hypothetical protein